MVKKHLQDYIKRVRKNTGKKLKYFAVGEFGEKSHRPHYHLIMYGISVTEPEITASWPYGNTHIGSVTPESMKYVAKYCIKASRTSSSPVLGFGAEPHSGENAGPVTTSKKFMTCSQGLGSQWAVENLEEWRESQKTTIGGRPAGIPRYYKLKNNVVSIKNPEWQQAMADQLEKTLEQEGIDGDHIDSYRARQVKQTVFALKAKSEMSAREPG